WSSDVCSSDLGAVGGSCRKERRERGEDEDARDAERDLARVVLVVARGLRLRSHDGRYGGRRRRFCREHHGGGRRRRGGRRGGVWRRGGRRPWRGRRRGG